MRLNYFACFFHIRSFRLQLRESKRYGFVEFTNMQVIVYSEINEILISDA